MLNLCKSFKFAQTKKYIMIDLNLYVTQSKKKKPFIFNNSFELSCFIVLNNTFMSCYSFKRRERMIDHMKLLLKCRHINHYFL